MNEKETDMKRGELSEGAQAAEQLNSEAGTDYKAIPSDQEPADLIFIKSAATENRHHKEVGDFSFSRMRSFQMVLTAVQMAPLIPYNGG
jgi:hypothetical protein